MVGQFFQAAWSSHLAGDIETARENYHLELRQAPEFAVALNNLAEAEMRRKHYPLALALAEKAVAIQPNAGNHWGCLGGALDLAGRHREAVEAYRKSLELIPGHPKTWMNIGASLYEVNDLDGALAAMQHAHELDPLAQDIKAALGIIMLARGDLLGGLEKFEARWSTLTRQPIWNLGIQEWQGEDLDGKTIAIHHEQGHGDTLQFIRFSDELSRLGATVVALVPGPMVRICRTVPGITQIIEYDRLYLSDFYARSIETWVDYHSPLTSVPRHLGVTYERLEGGDLDYLRHPYMFGNKRVKLDAPEGTRLRIGIIWAGQGGYEADKQRSMPVECMLELFKLRGVQLYSLQLGERAKDLTTAGLDGLIPDLAGRFHDWMATAEVMQSLDLVVTVDTAPAHLAGALGVPVLMLNAHKRCWRWLRDRMDTPWYPSMTLFTQVKPGGWVELMRRVAKNIEFHYLYTGRV